MTLKILSSRNTLVKEFFCETYFLLYIKGEPGNYNIKNKNEEIQ